jgi:subtilase family serine protease
MNMFSRTPRAKALFVAGCAALLVNVATAQKPEARILTAVDNSTRVTLTGSRSAALARATDLGRMPATTALQGVNLVFSRSAAQQAALDDLIAAQQNPASPKYHQWLSPDQFAAEFGAADADIAKVQTWLGQQGFTVNEVSRNRSIVNFSGNVAEVEAAFGTEMHYFNVGGVKHFAPATDLSIPAAFGGVVMTVGNLTDFRPHSQLKPGPKAAFTSSQSGSNFVQPGDVSVIYDINAAYNAGYTGAGQTIAIIGQSAIATSDIAAFQNASGTPVKSPTVVLMPNTGASTIYEGDEAESDLDIEYSGAIGKGANIVFVYTGNSSNYGAFDAMGYAIQNKLASIISVSYGECEPLAAVSTATTASDYSYYTSFLAQAAAQGQTVISAAGDDGSSGCYEFDSNGLTAAQQGGLAVSFPASSQYVTAMGGTEFPSADISGVNGSGVFVAGANSATYWATSTGTDVITSAKSYIPEMVWNDDLAGINGDISSGGGGVSILTARPSWQAGVPGIPAGSYRLLPDISLASSPNNAGYLYCSSDASTGITGSCTYGFRNSANTSLTIAGGTSFAAPIFAGMLSIINQKVGAQYQGVINPTLYTLASNATTYAAAFHDITSGTNECASGAEYPVVNSSGTTVLGPACQASAAAGYSAGVGYDEASGLGSVDLYQLLTAWPAVTTTTVGSSTTLTAATLNPQQGAGDLITIKVASTSSSQTATPTGTVSVSVDGSYLQTLTLNGGSATYTFSSTLIGPHVVSGVYSGDTNFSGSTGALTVTVVTSTLKANTTVLTAATTPATTGVADAITITVGNGTSPAPTGTVTVTVDSGTPTVLPLTPGTTSSTAVYSFNTSSATTHSIVAMYSGDSNYQTSSGTLSLVAAAPGSFSLSASALTITHGSTGSEAIAVTPSTGFTGAVNLTLTTATNIVNACYTVTQPTVSGTTAATGTATIYTNSTSCPSGASALLRTGSKLAETEMTPAPGSRLPLGATLAGLLVFGFAGRRSRKLRGLVLAAAMLAAVGFGLAGCGSSSTSTGTGIPTTAPTGTYTVTVTGTDAATGTKTVSTTFTLTIN